MQQGKPAEQQHERGLVLLNSRMNADMGNLREPFSRIGSACRQLLALLSCVSRVSRLLFFPDTVLPGELEKRG